MSLKCMWLTRCMSNCAGLAVRELALVSRSLTVRCGCLGALMCQGSNSWLFVVLGGVRLFKHVPHEFKTRERWQIPLKWF